MLRDMEDLVSEIKNDEIKLYMSEVLKCYSIEAYRACIVLSVIAGMYDFKEKIDRLAQSIQGANILYIEIEKRISNQDTYEKYMIEQAAKENLGIISPSERDTILSLLDIRNRCAHPSGHFSSAEEARYVFTGVIDYIISKPVLVGAARINGIVEELKKDIFGLKNEENINRISHEIYDKLHKTAIMPLCDKLVKIIINPVSEEIQKNNSTYLLAGLSRLINETDKFIDKIKPILLNEKCKLQYSIILDFNIDLVKNLDSSVVNLILSNYKKIESKESKICNGILVKLMKGEILDKNQRINLLNIITNTEEKVNEVTRRYSFNEISDSFQNIKFEIIYELIKECNLDDSEKYIVEDGLMNEFDKIKIIDKSQDYYMLESWSKHIQQLPFVRLQEIFINTLIYAIRHFSYSIQNFSVAILDALDKDFINKSSIEMKVKIISAILYGAGGNAYDCITILNSGFKSQKELIKIFINEIAKDNDSFNEIYKDVWHVKPFIEFYFNTNNVNELMALIEKLQTWEIDKMNKWSILNELYYYMDKTDKVTYKIEIEKLENYIKKERLDS